MPARSLAAVIRFSTPIVLYAGLFCTGCATPGGCGHPCAGCGEPVAGCCEDEPSPCDACDVCEAPACEPCCQSGYCEKCWCHTQAACECCTSTAKCYACGCSSRVWCCAEPYVCWPWRKCMRVVNFCAPDGCCNPIPGPGPGRFHPVPTHPVFEPGPQPMMLPPQRAGETSAPQ